MSSSISASMNSTPGRSFIQQNTGVSGYNYSISTLSDILSKREFLYREYFLNKGYNTILPKYFISSPSNTLFNEIKNSYPLVNPTNFTSEISRDFFYQNSNFIKFTLLKELHYILDESIFKTGINNSFLNNYLFFYMFDSNSNYSINKNSELFKNQYRPMKKGINNMIRLHATGAIGLPIEMRLHIIASSKDVIHSWSIPSAGIKIDCIPGYSSHRVTIFLVSGIF
jgi:heme/copper-type cytochrome/quinol oxidase subunit 2